MRLAENSIRLVALKRVGTGFKNVEASEGDSKISKMV